MTLIFTLSESEGRVFSTVPIFKFRIWTYNVSRDFLHHASPMLVNFTSFSPPSTGSGEQAEMPASL